MYPFLGSLLGLWYREGIEIRQRQDHRRGHYNKLYIYMAVSRRKLRANRLHTLTQKKGTGPSLSTNNHMLFSGEPFPYRNPIILQMISGRHRLNNNKLPISRQTKPSRWLADTLANHVFLPNAPGAPVMFSSTILKLRKVKTNECMRNHSTGSAQNCLTTKANCQAFPVVELDRCHGQKTEFYAQTLAPAVYRELMLQTRSQPTSMILVKSKGPIPQSAATKRNQKKILADIFDYGLFSSSQSWSIISLNISAHGLCDSDMALFDQHSQHQSVVHPDPWNTWTQWKVTISSMWFIAF